MYSMLAYFIIFFTTFLLKIEGSNEFSQSVETKKSTAFKEMLPIIKRYPAVLTALFLTFVPILFIGGFNLVVIEVSEIQHDKAVKGLLYTTEGICFLIGAFLVKRVSKGRNMIKVLLTGSFFITASQFLLYFSGIKLISLVSFGLFGVAAGFFFPISATLYQKQIPKEFHGRFFSFKNMLDRVLFQVVLLGTGLFLDTIGLKNMVIIFGVFSTMIASYFAIKQLKTPVSYIDTEIPQSKL